MGKEIQKKIVFVFNIGRRISLNDLWVRFNCVSGANLKLGRNFFHGDVKKHGFPETVFNVDTRKFIQLCSAELCNAGFAKNMCAVLKLFSVLTYE